jgi:para-nitrobenzyl esterase
MNLAIHLDESNRTAQCARALLAVLAVLSSGASAFEQHKVATANGALEGSFNTVTGVRSFKGVPFAAPPVGELRWKPPQPVKNWEGVRAADKFGPRAMQLPLFSDMVFRSNGTSEDCLYLNVWTPATSSQDKLPVLVYFFGGGFAGGDGSEGRYDGESMAQQGIVAITVNYRLGVFGFFAHPELTKESPQHASGNYGLLDQSAALGWVRQNIAAFGGDPKRVTIAGESAGSISVCAQMASPLSKDLIAGAIGESGGAVGPPLMPQPLAEAEAKGVKIASGLGIGAAPTLAALREIPAEQLLKTAAKAGGVWFGPTLDGYFFPKQPADIFAAGDQARVPLLAGTNSEESGYGGVLKKEKPTVENYRKALESLYPGKGDEVFKLYPAENENDVMDAAQALASDRFIGYGTWKWIDLATKTGGQPTYYYLYAHPRPAKRPIAAPPNSDTKEALPKPAPKLSRGASHSAEIEYAMGNLATNTVYAWTPDDFNVSKQMQAYFANFIKTGNPNGAGLPEWPKFSCERRLAIDVNSRAEATEILRARGEFFDRNPGKKK